MAPHCYHLRMSRPDRTRRAAAHEIAVDESVSRAAHRQLPGTASRGAFRGLESTGCCAAARFGSTAAACASTTGCASGDVVRVPPVWIAEPRPRMTPSPGTATEPSSGQFSTKTMRFDPVEQARRLGRTRRKRIGFRRDRVLARIQAQGADAWSWSIESIATRRVVFSSPSGAAFWPRCTRRCERERVHKRYLALVRGNFRSRRRRSDVTAAACRATSHRRTQSCASIPKASRR